MLGKTIAHYQVVEKLGEGGMGVVYKARDTHLDRFVALKVLPADKLADPERLRRFVQEAKAASALNHPNIIHIYDIAEDGGVHYIAMEYVEGKTLEERIGRRGLRLGETLKYAVQIADALARAHAAGIVHRDLKPSNLMVDEHGLVKVLDFGLAKLTQAQAGDSSDTQTMPLTSEGKILGTVAYMSPEQAEAKDVDARSDIFSFGSVLYEMATGRKAFSAATRMSTLSAILHQEPAPFTPGENVPRDLEKLIARCLRKDPDRRFHHMIDLKVALQELKEESESGSLSAEVPAGARVARRWPWALAMGAVVLLAAVGIGLWMKQSSAPAVAAVPTRLTADSGLTTEPALSPDGKLVAYASDRAGGGNLDIWVQNVAGGEANRLTSDPADEREPAFSPDGSKIAFRSEKDGGGIWVIPSFGGEARMIAKQGRRPRFSPDGNWLAYYVGASVVGGLAEEIYVVASSGGAPRRIETGLTVASHPVWTPDGRHLLFIGADYTTATARYDWWVAPLDGGRNVKSGAVDMLRGAGFNVDGDDAPVTPPGAWLEDHVIFSGQLRDSRNLWRIPISSRTWQATGAPQRLTSGTSIEVQPSVAVASDHSIRMVFSSLTSSLNVWSLAIDTDKAKVLSTELKQLTTSTYDAQCSLSRDGKRLAFVSNRSGNRDIWLKDLVSGKETAVTATAADEFGPEISWDGSQVAYQVIENNKWSFFIAPIGSGGQAGAPESVCAGCVRLWDLSRDGRRLLFIYELAEPASVGLLNRDTGEKTQWLKHPKWGLYRLRFSPDNRWVSLHASVGSGRTRVYIVPFRVPAPAENEWIEVTKEDGFHDKVVWAANGNLLYYTSDRDGFRCIRAQRLDPVTKRPVGQPLDVYHSHSARRSLLNAEIIPMEIAVAPDKLVFNLCEITGNVWMAALAGR